MRAAWGEGERWREVARVLYWYSGATMLVRDVRDNALLLQLKEVLDVTEVGLLLVRLVRFIIFIW